MRLTGSALISCRAAHAASAPDRGRSALDGVEAMNYMVNLMREHVPQTARLHYVITDGGDAPNIVPETAQVYYYVRHPDRDQVVELLKTNIQLNETGNVEILDKNGIARYSKSGELLTTDELVQEFLTQNPHFVSATPSGSGTVSNVDRQELNKPLNLSELNMNNPEDRKKYAEYRKQRNSKPYVINSNP